MFTSIVFMCSRISHNLGLKHSGPVWLAEYTPGMEWLFLWMIIFLFGKGLFLGIVIPMRITNPLHIENSHFSKKLED
jgi:hypothetical protein